MQEIDEMDMLGYFKIRAWKAKEDKEKSKPKPKYIDEVWPEMKSR